MNGMTTVIHYPSPSCARVMHFPSAFHACSVSGCIVSEIGIDTHVSMCTKEVMLASMPEYNLDGSLTGRLDGSLCCGDGGAERNGTERAN